MKDRSLTHVAKGRDITTVTVTDFVPTDEEIRLLATKPLPEGLRAIDNCGGGSEEYKHNSPLAIWKISTVPYYLDATVPTALVDGIKQSFGKYNELFANKISFIPSSNSDSKIIVKFAPIDESGRTLARANWSYSTSSLSLTKATITFDSSEKWAWLGKESCGSTGSTYDIGNVAVHEIGHVVGLSHAPTDPLQTMYASTSPGKTLGRTLGNGDTKGVRLAYNLPIVSPNPPPTEIDIEIILNNIKTVLDKQKLKISEAETERHNLELLVDQLEEAMT